VLWLEEGVLALLGETLGGDDRLLSLLSELVGVECHGEPPLACRVDNSVSRFMRQSS
jgi:hypothetical protein